MAEGQIIIKKKKVVGGHGHHGGSWKVAYADFVTAMMAFFMVMWIMGLSDDTRTKIQGYFNDPLGFNKQSPRSRAVISLKFSPGGRSKVKGGSRPDLPGMSPGTNTAALEKAQQEIQDAIAQSPDLKLLQAHTEITMTDEGLRIEFKEAYQPVFFESGSAVLRPAANELIAKVGPILGGLNCQLVIEGHTDAKRYSGTGYTNWDLSSERARALYHGLLNHGVDETNVEGVRPYAATRLRDPQNPLNPANRRVSILVPRETNKEILGGTDKEPKPNLKEGVQIAPKKIDIRDAAFNKQ